MSGGEFDYRERSLIFLKEELEELLEDRELIESHEQKEQVVEKIKTAIKLLDLAYIYMHRIDYLMSGDDGEESFFRRLKEDIKEYLS